MKPGLLIVDDEPLIRASLRKAFAGYTTEVAGSVAEATATLGKQHFELAIIDLKLPDGSGLELVRRIAAESPETKTVVITAHASVETAVEAMKLGAYDFVRKPFELEELMATAANAVRSGRLERRVEYTDARERSRTDEAAVALNSAAMARLEHELGMLAGQPIPVVLVVGETGSGKALVARRIHYHSGRPGGPFVELNVAAVPDSLVESELFGHERGAFSDARERKLGLVEVADGGTLFLDEIGELSATAQAKLLTFLESFSFRRLGATATRTVDLRVVAATNRDLPSLVAAGRFRADLYFRLSSLTLQVPPLRARAADVAPLAAHFLRMYTQRFRRRFTSISEDAAIALAAWRWPGNVRELKSVLQRAVLMNDSERLELQHLPPELVAQAVNPIPEILGHEDLPTLEEIERRYMRKVLELTGGNKVRAAEHLGITRQTLAKRLGESD